MLCHEWLGRKPKGSSVPGKKPDCKCQNGNQNRKLRHTDVIAKWLIRPNS